MASKATCVAFSAEYKMAPGEKEKEGGREGGRERRESIIMGREEQTRAKRRKRKSTTIIKINSILNGYGNSM